MRTIGFAGTAKNTGKTTTALAAMKMALAGGLRVAVTSIGFDGEGHDHITNLPKPRYHLPAGALIATARECLEHGSAVCSVLVDTGIHTAFGPIQIAEVQQPGLVTLVGPNRKVDLETVCSAFDAYHADLTLVDGALNRLTPLMEVDGLVLATGAAYCNDISAVAAHTAAMVELMRQPLTQHQSLFPKYIQLGDRTGKLTYLNSTSIFESEDVQALTPLVTSNLIYAKIPGLAVPDYLLQWIEACKSNFKGAEVTFNSPFNLTAVADPLVWLDYFKRINEFGAKVTYETTVPLLAVTTNPFYPCYDAKTWSYYPASVDPAALLAAVRAAVPNLPVVNLHKESLDFLFLFGFKENA